MILKKISIYFILIPLLALSCHKDKTNTLDITKHKWKLKSITINSEKFIPKEKKSRYVLEFTSDTNYKLNFSINSGGGLYKIPSKGVIKLGITAQTEICCENDFDNKLLETIPRVTSYTVIGNELILKLTDGKIEFKRKW